MRSTLVRSLTVALVGLVAVACVESKPFVGTTDGDAVASPDTAADASVGTPDPGASDRGTADPGPADPGPADPGAPDPGPGDDGAGAPDSGLADAGADATPSDGQGMVDGGADPGPTDSGGAGDADQADTADVGDPCLGVDCDDANPCTFDSCLDDGACVNLAVEDDTPCDDGKVCTVDDKCLGAACTGSAPDCADGDPCTNDGCIAGVGCVSTFTAAGAPCAPDGDPCTNDGTCGPDGACVGRGPIDCDDGEPCTVDSCSNGLCDFAAAADGTGCDDGDACTTGDTCSGGSCSPGSAVGCDDDNPCTDDGCDALGGCIFLALPDDTPCDDGDGCTAGDSCNSGTCVGVQIDCEDDLPCTTVPCDDGACGAVQINPGSCLIGGVACYADGDADPAEPCTFCAPTVNQFVFAGTLADLAPCTDDDNECTLDACLAGVCEHFGLGADPCDDGIACTTNDTCQAGSCVGNSSACDLCTTFLDCPGADACTDTRCVSGFCQYDAVGWDATLGDASAADRLYAVTQLASGDALAAGTRWTAAGPPDGWLLRLDGSGAQRWSRTYGEDGADRLLDVARSGPGYLAVGGSEDAAGEERLWLLRLDAAGEVISQAVQGAAGTDTAAFGVAQAPAGRHALGGHRHYASDETYAAWLAMVNADDSLAWEVEHHRGNAHVEEVATAADGAAVGVGFVTPGAGPARDLWVVRHHADGALAWEKSFGTAGGDEYGTTVLEQADGTLVVSGSTDTQSSSAIWLLGLGGGGELLWETTYTLGWASQVAHDAAATADGGLLLAGQGFDWSSTDVVLMRLDGQGNRLWERTWGGADHQALEALAVASGGSVLAAGGDVGDGYVVRVDAWGRRACDPASGCHAIPQGLCADGAPCTSDDCTAADGCVHASTTGSCNDGDACTSGDSCAAGSCAGAPKACDDGDDCTDDPCDGATGTCLHPDAPTGTLCDDGDICTVGATCDGGVCQAGAPKACDDGNPCTNDVCLPSDGSCIHTQAADGTGCDDGQDCTEFDQCAAGSCAGSTVLGCVGCTIDAECDDGLPCTIDRCLLDFCANDANAWQQDLGASADEGLEAVAALPDGTFVAVGGRGLQAIAVRYDASGGTLWDETLGDGAWYGVVAVTGGVVVAGAEWSQARVARIDLDGGLAWERTRTGRFNAIAQTPTGELAAVGAVASGSQLGAGARVVTFDGAGNPLSERTYRPGGGAEAHAVVALPGGGLVLGGEVDGEAFGGQDAWVARLDAAGAVVWEAVWGGPSADVVYGLAPTTDGGWMAAGRHWTANNGGQAMLTRLNGAGARLWQRRYDGQYASSLNGIAALADGGFATAGSANANDGLDDQIRVQRLDPSGNVLWSQTFGSAGLEADAATGVVDAGGDGLLAVGRTHSPLGNIGWIGRLDRWGGTTCDAACAALPLSACDDGKACTQPVCSGGGCVQQTVTGACRALGLCTDNGACLPDGTCAATPKLCEDGDPCTFEGCTDGVCSLVGTPDGAPCDDDLACTTGDVCSDGTCGGATTCSPCGDDGDCSDDGDACTLDVCLGGLCTSLPSVWSATTENGDFALNAIVPLPGGGITAAGTTNGSGAGGTDLWLARATADSPLLWEATAGTTEDEQGYAATALTTGGTLVVGQGQSKEWNVPVVYVARFDALGARLWEREIPSTNRSAAHGVVDDGDSAVVLAETGDDPADLWLLRLAPDGLVMDGKRFESAAQHRAADLAPAAGGGTVALASTTGGSGGAKDFWLLRLDDDFNVLWDKTYGGVGDDVPHALAPLADGGWLLVGETSEGAGGDAWLVRVDAAGGVVWSQAFGTAGLDYLSDGVELADGTFGLVGATTAAAQLDGWYVRISADGQASLVDVTFPLAGDDRLQAIAPVAGGGLFVVGHSGAEPAEEASGTAQIRKITADGAEVCP